MDQKTDLAGRCTTRATFHRKDGATENGRVRAFPSATAYLIKCDDALKPALPNQGMAACAPDYFPRQRFCGHTSLPSRQIFPPRADELGAY